MGQKTFEQFLELVHVLLLGFVLTSKTIIRYCSFHGYSGLASLMSNSLYLLTLVSLLLVCTRMHYLKASVIGILTFILMYIYQVLVVSSTNLSEYWSTFFVSGFSGLVCGLVITNERRLINISGFFAVIYGIMLLPEPFTKGMLGYTSMSLGYTMAPLCIWLLMCWYQNKTVFKRIIFIEFLLLSIITILFTSRGCGLAIIASVIILYVIDGISNGKEISRRVLAIGTVVFIGYFSLTQIAISYVKKKGITLLTGSLLNKMINGVASDSNGRDTILRDAIDLLLKNPVFGVGIAQDRVVLGYVFPHNVLVEVFLHFGLLFGIVLFIVYWNKVIKGIKIAMKYSSPFFIPLLCAMYWIRLFFSDSYLDNMFGLMLIIGYALRLTYLKVSEKKQYERI